MTQESYAYENRSGIHPISWEDFHAICKGLARAAARYDPEIVLAVGRGGYYPGTLISHILRAEIYPVRISRRVNDVVKHKKPKWLVKPPKLVKNRRVLIVDEISSTGETLLKVKKRVLKMGAKEVRSAVMYAHTGGTDVPDYIGLITDELLLNPWDREIYADGRFRFHPEYVGALEQQGIPADSSLLIDVKAVRVAKG
jgi:hypoxanthine phosphoribosyltransferase